ncbi:MAG: transcription elongation factor GreA [Bacteroidales bacterium]|nr:transcription elongation factor GreA [Bacteroidales bacterium]
MKYYNEEGLKRLEDELQNLIAVERPAIALMIAEAHDKGDLSENAEYHAAKEAQGMLEMRISKLEELVRNARIIDESKLDVSKVLILSNVKIKNIKTGAMLNYTIVPESEADLKTGKISVNSPIAKGLLGKKVGDRTEIAVPAGILTLQIVEITR